MKTLIALLAATFALCAHAADAPFPNRPITLICPWPAGGSSDTHLRKLAELASKSLGQHMIVENKPGFGLPHMQKVDWDPLRDYTYIIGVSGYTFGVVVKSESPFKTFSDLIAYARAHPGELSFGSTGNGTSPHLLMEEIGDKAGVKFLHVPFKGNADSTQALMGGHIMAQSDSTSWGKFVDAGTFRLLVTFGDERTRWGAPTAKELGYDVVSYSPYGIVGPKGMDPKVVKILHDAFKKAIDEPDNRKMLQQLDQVYWYKSSEDYAKWAAAAWVSERATIERLGLAMKPQ